MSTQYVDHKYAHDKTMKETFTEGLVFSAHEKKAFLSAGILIAGMILGSIVVGITSFFAGATVGWIAGGTVFLAALITFAIMAKDVSNAFRAEWNSGKNYIDPDRVQSRMAQLNQTEEEALSYLIGAKESKMSFKSEMKQKKALRKIAKKAEIKSLKKEYRKQERRAVFTRKSPAARAQPVAETASV